MAAKPIPTRTGKFAGSHPLCAGDLRRIVTRLDELGYPDAALVRIRTPLPPHDPRVVDLFVDDYTTDS